MAEKSKKAPDAEKKAAGQQPDVKKDSKTSSKLPSSAQLEAKLAVAQTQAEEAEKKLAEMKNSLLRTAAEYENYRKRSQKEQESSFSNGVGHAAFSLLPVLDTLDAAANAETKDEDYKKGVLLTLSKCVEVFDKMGIHEIPAMGEEFNPELHNAVMQLPAEGAASGTITQVIQKGYTLHEKVIRHSMVAVAP